MNELAFPGKQSIPVRLRVEEERYFSGANRYAATSVLWVRFAEPEGRSAEESISWMVQRLDDAGLDGSEIAERAGQATLHRIAPLDVFATAMLAVLEQGTIKSTKIRPEIVACRDYSVAIASTYPGKSEMTYALDLLLDLFNGPSHEPADELRSYVLELADDAYQPSLGVSLKAAEDRGIPWMWQEDIAYYQLGHGRHRKRIMATITENLPALGYDIARRKTLTNELLRSLAIPVPHSIETVSLDEAEAAARELGYPVVVKPARGHKGIGITVGVKNLRELAVAFRKASETDESVLVEQFIPGGDVRLLVVGEKLVAAASRCPPQVTGDGTHSIEQLIDMENARRSRNPGIALPIEIDADLKQNLTGLGLMLSTVLDVSEVAQLRKTANWSQGGTATDLTDIVHPDNADMAIRAALAVGLDVAGVDFITPDISRPFHEVGGAICEVNYRPGLRVQLAADPDCKRDLGSPIIESLFPSGNGRIHAVFILDAEDCALATGLANRFADFGETAVLIDAYRCVDDWQANIDAALADPDCDALIVNAPSGAIVDLGCGMDYCSHVVLCESQDSEQALASSILGKICKPECCLTFQAGDDMGGLLAGLAKALDLRKMPAVKPAEPAKITKSRSMRVVAEARGLPVTRRAYWIDRTLFQIGYGASMSLYRGARTGRTSYIATRIADSKQRTNALLRKHGLPHTRQTVARSWETALEAARECGYPVVVKPANSSESRGVTANILNDDELADAFEGARDYSRTVIMEPFLQGKDHRFLIVGGRMVHATRHDVAHVVGDGKMTVDELVQKANENPLRGPDPWEPYTLLELDAEATRILARQKFSASTVLGVGQRADLSTVCSLSVGATAEDVTEIAHADNIAAAQKAARLVGLDICGIDFLLPDVSRSYRETGGAILEVNQRPSFDMHDASTGSTNRVRDTILQELLNGKAENQIPVVRCMLSDNHLIEPIARSALERLSSSHGLTGGVAAPELGFAMVGSAVVAANDGSVSSVCNSILGDRRVEAVLFMTGKEPVAEIPESARILDFCPAMSGHSVDTIADSIVSEILGHAA